MHPHSTSSLRRVLCVASVVWLGLVAAAAAAPASVIPSKPLRVIVERPGQVDAQFTDAPFGEIDAGPSYPNGGLLIATYDASGQPIRTYGWHFGSTDFETVQEPVLSGSGASGDPFRLVSVYSAGDLQITGTLEAVNGDSGFLARYRLENQGADARRFRLIVAADLDRGPDPDEPGFNYEDAMPPDNGVGVTDGDPPTVIGAENDESGSTKFVNPVVAGATRTAVWPALRG